MPQRNRMIELTAEIVAAHVGRNLVPTEDLPPLIANVHAILGTLERENGNKARALDPPPSADHIICLACGKKQRTLRRHLAAAHGLSPEQYRAVFALPSEYSMNAPSYSQTRRLIAKEHRLGVRPQPDLEKR